MNKPVLVYRGDELASYGFGDSHPFGLDRHDVFHDELAEAGLGDAIQYAAPRAASVDELLLFHTADYIDKVSRMSSEGKGFLDDGDTPALPGIFNAASNVVGTTRAAVDTSMQGEAERAVSSSDRAPIPEHTGYANRPRRERARPARAGSSP